MDFQQKLNKIEFLQQKALLADQKAVVPMINRVRKMMASLDANTSGKDNAFSEDQVRKQLRSLERKLYTSIHKRKQRIANLPNLTFPEQLPICQKKEEIIEAIKEHPVVIISGETGSGKTTQIPKCCVAAGRGIEGMIGCTQPRRIAAISVANRIAEEVNDPIGNKIGYKTRFLEKLGQNTCIKIMTDGMLLAETQIDPDLKAYDTIIVDEAHERSLNIDFILGILKKLIKRRPELKLIITSATIDTEKFSKSFDNAPIISVSGRMYPVDVRYFKKTDDEESDEDQTYIEHAVKGVKQILFESFTGDILVFMPTEQDIRETCELLEKQIAQKIAILPLFARLSAGEQNKVFAASDYRKIVVATNVAETSITIPGIKYVVDTGVARILKYSPSTRTNALPILPVSRSSADQRKGRCGRVENGICIRLFSEEDYNNRPLFSQPEILRSNLAEVILRMLSLKLGHISDFPFIDPPEPRSIQDGYKMLEELGAIEYIAQNTHRAGKDRYALTKNGRLMAQIPLDPRLSRMLIQAKKHGCVKEMAVIVSALSIQDPRERPLEKAEQADSMQSKFNHELSDFMSLLNIWNNYQKLWSGSESKTSIRRFCKTHFLSYMRMREWRDIHNQIVQIIKECKLESKHQATDLIANPKAKFDSVYEAIHKSILSGFLSHIALKKDRNLYTAAKNQQVMIFPGSGLFNTGQNWVVAAEFVYTSRLFARTVANIDSDWLEEIAKDRCKYTYKDPHWQRKHGHVVAHEQVSLFGLIIVGSRNVSYSRIDPEGARKIFIQSALVDLDVSVYLDFMKHNQQLIEEILAMENRLRRRDILVNQDQIVDWYEQRLGMVYDMHTLKKEISQKQGDHYLRMTKTDLMCYDPDQEDLSQFPAVLNLDKSTIDCEYQFDPGQDRDGLTLKIPLNLAPAIPIEPLDWMVPGLFVEKVSALIKALPKQYRKQLLPINKTVETITSEISQTETSLFTALSQFIHKRFSVDIPASAWSDKDLPDHLKVRLSIVGPDGRELYAGRDKQALAKSFTAQVPEKRLKQVKQKWEKDHLITWDFPDLPDQIVLSDQHGPHWEVFVGLCPAKDKNKDADQVNLRIFQNREAALKSHAQGMVTLYSHHFAKELKFLKRRIFIPPQATLWSAFGGGVKKVVSDIFQSTLEELFAIDIRTRKAFYDHAQKIEKAIYKTGETKTQDTLAILEAVFQTQTFIARFEKSRANDPVTKQFAQNLYQEINMLVPEGFMYLYQTQRVPHIVRYIKAVGIRAQRGFVDYAKDKVKAVQVKTYTDQLNKMISDLSPATSKEKQKAIEDFHWLIEEFKVSLFAQELKTPFPISIKKLKKAVEDINRMI